MLATMSMFLVSCGRWCCVKTCFSSLSFPELPPGYSYTPVTMGYRSPTPLAHSADPADAETMQPVPTAAEPEQSRTIAHGAKIHCDARSALTERASPREQQITANTLDTVEQNEHSLLRSSEEKETANALPTENSTVEQLEPSVKDNVPCLRHLIASQGNDPEGRLEGEECRGQTSAVGSAHSTVEPTTLTNNTLDVRNSDHSSLVPEADLRMEGGTDEEAAQKNQDEDCESHRHASERDEVLKWRVDCVAGMNALVAAGLSMGELLALEPDFANIPVPPSRPATSTFNPCSGMHGIALLSELAELEQRQQNYDGTAQGNFLNSHDPTSVPHLNNVLHLLIFILLH